MRTSKFVTYSGWKSKISEKNQWTNLTRDFHSLLFPGLLEMFVQHDVFFFRAASKRIIWMKSCLPWMMPWFYKSAINRLQFSSRKTAVGNHVLKFQCKAPLLKNGAVPWDGSGHPVFLHVRCGIFGVFKHGMLFFCATFLEQNWIYPQMTPLLSSDSGKSKSWHARGRVSWRSNTWWYNTCLDSDWYSKTGHWRICIVSKDLNTKTPRS